MQKTPKALRESVGSNEDIEVMRDMVKNRKSPAKKVSSGMIDLILKDIEKESKNKTKR